MPKILFVDPDGSSVALDVPAGTSVRDAAVEANLRGIEGECGGFLNCATCHVFVEPAWQDRLDPVGEVEDEMLDGTAVPRRENSRLSCQLVVSDEVDGLAVEMPESQY